MPTNESRSDPRCAANRSSAIPLRTVELLGDPSLDIVPAEAEVPTDPETWWAFVAVAPGVDGGAYRRPKAKRAPSGKGQIVDPVMISERPAEIAERAVPGHWEGDLLMGKRMTAIGTLVERHTRYVMLFPLPEGNTAEAGRTRLAATVQRLPDQLWKSLTWDQGKEMAHHAQFTVDTGVQVFFCEPRSPWQRGSNENTNGLLR